MRILLVLAALTVAGCASPAGTSSERPEDAGEPRTPEPAPLVTLPSCDHHEGFFYIPLEDAQALLPPPLVAARYQQGTAGGFYVSAVSCEDGVASGIALDTPRFVWAGIGVEPPEGVEEDLFFHGHLLASRHSHDALALAFEQLGQSRPEVGHVSFETTSLPTGAHVGAVEADGVRLSTQVAAEQADIEDVHARFYAVDDGIVTGGMDLLIAHHALIIGSATLHAPTGVFGIDAPPMHASVGYQGPLADMRLQWWQAA